MFYVFTAIPSKRNVIHLAKETTLCNITFEKQEKAVYLTASGFLLCDQYP